MVEVIHFDIDDRDIQFLLSRSTAILCELNDPLPVNTVVYVHLKGGRKEGLFEAIAIEHEAGYNLAITPRQVIRCWLK